MGPVRSRAKKAQRHNPLAGRPTGQHDKPAAKPQVHTGRYPGLLDKANSQLLRIGVDFGTDNSSAAFVVVDDKEDKILEHIDRIHSLHTLNEKIRFPTLAAFKTLESSPRRGQLVFAQDVLDGLYDGTIKVDNIVSYPKLGLIDDFSGIFDADKGALEKLQARHLRTLKNATRDFDSVVIRYPDGNVEQDVVLTAIDDIVVRCLKYFLSLIKVELRKKLQISQEQIEWVMSEKTEVGFAAPTFWKDSMLDSFLRLIQEAGWPTYCKIWSEPKCALSAYVAGNVADLSRKQRDEMKGRELDTVRIVIDIGGGSLDATTIRATEITDDTIKFACIAESSGSLCGGRLLNDNIENRIKKTIGLSINPVLQALGDAGDSKIDKHAFWQSFLYDKSRRNFDADKETYPVQYGGNNLPSAQYEYMTPRSVILTKADMVAVHDSHVKRVIKHVDEQVKRVIKHVDEQVKRTQEATHGQVVTTEVVLIGGVTRAPYIVRKIKEHLAPQEDIIVTEVEDFEKPLVAIGCILSLGQPGIGRRFATKEAYGVPIAEAFDKGRHRRGNKWEDERTDMGEEARDLTDWIVKGQRAELSSEVYDWSVSFLNDDDTPCKTDPRKNPKKTFPVTIEQDILSCAHRGYGTTDRLEYKNVPQIELRKKLRIQLSQEQCMSIHDNTDYTKRGFWRDSTNGNWFFTCPVRVILEWHDIRLTWRAEIPKCGDFEKNTSGITGVWHKEVVFALIGDHGVRDGDAQNTSRMDIDY